MTCQRCGTENSPGNRFCIKCGADLVAADPGAATGPAGSAAGNYVREEASTQQRYDPPAQGAYAPPGEYSNPYSAPSNYGMIQQGYAYQGQPGMVWRQDQLVGFGTRFVAYLIDSLVLAAIIIVAIVIAAIFVAAKVDALAVLVYLVMVAAIFVYFPYFWATRDGQTPGKKAMHIKVARTDGRPMTAGTAIIRLLGYYVSGFLFDLGYLWIIWDPLKQGWHDKIASTVVVRT